MAYDEVLAERIRELLADQADVSEQRMFGGLGFLVGGNLAVAASGQGELMLRVDPGRSDELIAGGAARPMEMRGRPMKAWLLVDSAAVRTKPQLRTWVRVGVDAARSAPPKRRR